MRMFSTLRRLRQGGDDERAGKVDLTISGHAETPLAASITPATSKALQDNSRRVSPASPVGVRPETWASAPESPGDAAPACAGRHGNTVKTSAPASASAGVPRDRDAGGVQFWQEGSGHRHPVDAPAGPGRSFIRDRASNAGTAADRSAPACAIRQGSARRQPWHRCA